MRILLLLRLGLVGAAVSWVDVTSKPREGRHLSDNPQDVYIRRAPSTTVRILALHIKNEGLRRRHLEDNENFLFDGEGIGLTHGSTLELPLCTGGSAQFKLERSNLMPEEMRASFPTVRVYHGWEMANKSHHGAQHGAEITITPQGVRAQVWLPGGGRCFIDPMTHSRTDMYTAYHSNDLLEDTGTRGRRLSEAHETQTMVGELSATMGMRHKERRELTERRELQVNPIWTPTVPKEGKQSIRKLKFAVATSYEWVVGTKMVNWGTVSYWPGHSTCPACIDNTAGSTRPCSEVYAQCQVAAAAGFVTTMTRAGGIWRRAMGLDLELIGKQGALFKYPKYTKATPVGLINGDNSYFTAEGEFYIENYGNYATKNSATPTGVGSADYDMGHYFSIGNAGGVGGGTPCALRRQGKLNCPADPLGLHGASQETCAAWAGYKCPDDIKGICLKACRLCPSSQHKANGATASVKPVGDSFDTEYVAHELAHQFGISHTWTGQLSGCVTGQFATSFSKTSQAAMEMGAGSTLATYSGICGADNLQKLPDPYFHVYSLHEFETNFFQKSDMDTCGTKVEIDNSRPTATAFQTCTIPKRTAFQLEGTGSDPDEQSLSYTWEQIDPSPVQMAMSKENKKGNLFRSIMPSGTGNRRVFPKMATALKMGADKTLVDEQERLSSTARSMHFALTVRDNFHAAGGAEASLKSQYGSWHSAVSTVNVANVGPLVILNPPVGAGDGTANIPAGTFQVSFQLGGYKEHADTQSTEVKGLSFGVDITTNDGVSWTNLHYPDANSKLSASGAGSVTVVLPDQGSNSVDAQLRVYAINDNRKATYIATNDMADKHRSIFDRFYVGCGFWAPSVKFKLGAPPAIPTIDAKTPIGTSVQSGTTHGALKFSSPVKLSGTGTFADATAGAVTAVKVSGKSVGFKLPTLAVGTSYTFSFTSGYFKDAFNRDVPAGSVTFTTAATLCSETCNWSGDGGCDDGEAAVVGGTAHPSATFTPSCPRGTDCKDCGPRAASAGRRLDSSFAPVEYNPVKADADTNHVFKQGTEQDPVRTMDPTAEASSQLKMRFDRVLELNPDTTATITLEECFWSDDECKPHCTIAGTDTSQVKVEYDTLIITPFLECRVFRNGQFRLSINNPAAEEDGTARTLMFDAFGTPFPGLAKGSISWDGLDEDRASAADVTYEASAAYWFNTVLDKQAPLVTKLAPANNAVGASEWADVVLTFNADDLINIADECDDPSYTYDLSEYWGTSCTKSTKKIKLTGYWNDELQEVMEIPINDYTQVLVFQDLAQIIVWPSEIFYSKTKYFVTIDEEAVVDISHNAFITTGLGGTDENAPVLAFTTGNTIAPILSNFVAEVFPDNRANITLTFHSLGPCLAGRGLLNIVDMDTDDVVLTIDPADQESISYPPPIGVTNVNGNFYPVVIPVGPLPGPKTYAIRWPAGAFKDQDGNGNDPLSGNTYNLTLTGTFSFCVLGQSWSTTGLSPCAECTSCADSSITIPSFPCSLFRDAVCAPDPEPITGDTGYVITFSLTASGDVSDYTDTVKVAMGAKVAETAKVPTDRVTVLVTAGSVNIEFTIKATTAAAATAASSSLAPSIASASVATVLFSDVPGITISVATVTPISAPISAASTSGFWTTAAIAGVAAGASVFVLIICCAVAYCAIKGGIKSAVKDELKSKNKATLSSSGAGSPGRQIV